MLLDLGLPVVDGYRVAELLRARPDGGDVLLVAISGYGQPEDRERSKAVGFDHHLVKPIDCAELVALMRSGVRHAHRRTEPRSGDRGLTRDMLVDSGCRHWSLDVSALPGLPHGTGRRHRRRVPYHCAARRSAPPRPPSGAVGNRPPSVKIEGASARVTAGARLNLRANVYDPDGDEVTLHWTASAGTLSGASTARTTGRRLRRRPR